MEIANVPECGDTGITDLKVAVTLLGLWWIGVLIERGKMITIRNIQVYNIESALRGMRNPMNSWALGDSFEELAISSDLLQEAGAPMEFFDIDPFVCNYKRIVIGEKDIKLAQKLIKAGSEHSKFMRQIFVLSMDIEAPRYLVARNGSV